jgi:DNA-binding beta-propeller fold protein YncE
VTIKKIISGVLVAAIFVISAAQRVSPLQEETPLLQLVRQIPIPGVKGRLDHMDVDAKGQRLFLSGLENGTVEIIDVKSSQWVRSISGFKKPQGIAFVAALHKLFVASGDDAMVRVFDSETYTLRDSIQLETGPNRLAYDSRSKLLYVGYGGKDAGKDYGEIAVVDAKVDKKVGEIRVAAHPAELLLDAAARRLFALEPAVNSVQVIDTNQRAVTATWPVSSQRPGDAALDEATHRLVLGTHVPPEMVVIDARTGQEIAALPTVDGMDGVYFDSGRKRIYISGGRGYDTGSVWVYQQRDPDHYDLVGKIPTRPGAGTSFWSTDLDLYFVAAPAYQHDEAAILVFKPTP